MNHETIRNLLLAAVLGMALPAGADERLRLLHFEDAAETSRYQTNAGVSARVVKDASGRSVIEVEVAPLAEHDNPWPSLGIITPGLEVPPWDLTDYSRIEVKMQKLSSGLAPMSTLLSSLPINDGGANFEYCSYLLPGGETMLQRILLTDIVKACNDPSNLQHLQFVFPATSFPESYRIWSVEAVRDPAVGSLRDIVAADLKRVAANLSALETYRGKSYPELWRELTGLQERIGGMAPKGFAGQYNALRQALADLDLQVNAAFLAEVEAELYCWSYPAGIVLDNRRKPGAASPEVKALAIDMARNEYRDAAFMASATRHDLNLTARLEVPEALQGACEVFYTDYYYNHAGGYHAGDLIQPWEKPLAMAPGDSREVRIRVGGLDLPPGTYELRLILEDEALPARLELPVQLHIRPVELVQYPDNYVYSIFPAGNQAELDRHREALAAMKRYGMNVVEIPAVSINRATFDADGEVATFDDRMMEYSIGGIERMWRSLPGDQKIIFQLFCQLTPPLPEDPELRDRAYVNWIGKVVETLRSYGLGYDQFCLAYGDEASQAVLLDVEIPRAELVKKHFPAVRNFQNSSQVFEDEALNRRYFAAFDMLAPNMDSMRINPYLYPGVKASGKLASTYVCRHMDGFSDDLYDYYRVFLWRCFDMEIPTAGIWTFNAQETGLFREDQNRNNVGCSLVNQNREDRCVGTRRGEFYRDGINDWRYLLTLRAIGARHPERKAEIDAFLDEAVNAVLTHPEDRGMAEKQRRKIADKIMELNIR